MPNEEARVLWPGWETVRLIGRGSFGAVYEIQRDVLGEKEKAALKLITIPENHSEIEMMLDEGYDEASVTNTFREYLKNIVGEYSLMRKLNGCSNVVNCDDVRYVQHEDGFGWDIYIKMELLTPLIKTLGKEIPDRLAARIGADICKALVLCKKHNIIHRDIKPANIFVSDNGDYKLGDFGIAKTVERTRGGTKIGTYDYMAPEVYNNQPYGAGADIYSLGMVLYWLLNDKRTPFLPLPPATPTAAEKEQARLRRFSGEAIPAPAHGSPALQRIVRKAVAFDPKDRYQSAEDMLRDLESLANSEFGIRNPELQDDDRTVVVPHPPAAPVAPVAPSSARRDAAAPAAPGIPRRDAGAYAAGPSRPAPVYTPPVPQPPLPQPPVSQTPPRKKRWLPILLGALAVLAVALVLVLVPGIWKSNEVLPTVAPAHTPQIAIATISPFEGEPEETATEEPTTEEATSAGGATEEATSAGGAGAVELDTDIRVAMITDYGDITDQSFNQTTYEACKEYCEEAGLEFKYYKPGSDSNDDRITMIKNAIEDGFNVIVTPGYAFAPALVATAPEYPDVTFIALDVSESNLQDANGTADDYSWEHPANLYSAVYQEELGGFMAGFAAVKLGYKNLGFLGGMAFPAVIRYGYGFVQGADAAAAELGRIDITINFAYANQFYGDADITAAMDTWYAGGTEVVFACGGGIFSSVAEAASKFGGKVIGVDVDQAAAIDSVYGEGLMLTSAMKGLAPTVKTMLRLVQEGKFEGGKVETLGLVSENPEENYMQLPLDTTQFSDSFTAEDYKELVRNMLYGVFRVDNDITKNAADLATVVTVNDLGNLK